jgi:acyl transferase domain-containing protein
VVFGPEAAIRDLEARLGADGVGCKVLATSHAFHSPLMDGALEPFREALGRVRLAAPGSRGCPA